MNEPHRIEPELLALEARLSADVPHVSSAEQQTLLYACAFAAGKSAAKRTVHCWQALAAGLLVVAVGSWSWPAGSKVQLADVKQPEATQATAWTEPGEPVRMQHAVSAITYAPTPDRPAPLLDAWQLPDRRGEEIARELARFETIDPVAKSVSLASLSRTLLVP